MKVWSGARATGWLVEKTSGFLDARLSRRSFVSKATLAGTAIAASGCAVITQPGSPFTYITDCGRGSLCRDGYTEFCCVINQGVNACPPGSIASGWWRADYSVYCNGTRYYIDCNDFGGGGPCRCGAGCDTRKVYCNHFRYGQCAQWVPGTGVIACRMVTCVPPFLIPELGCSPSGAVDNATAGHFTDCGPYTPPPPPPPPSSPPALLPSLGGAASPADGDVAVFVRDGSGGVSYRWRTAGVWADWAILPGLAVTSRVVAASPADGEILVFAKGDDEAIWMQRFAAGSWAPAWTSLGSTFASDPVAVVVGAVTHVFARAANKETMVGTVTSGSWSGWTSLGGTSTSDPTAAVSGSDIHLFVRGTDSGVWWKRFSGGSWSGWSALAGWVGSDPAAVAHANGVQVFARINDFAYWARWLPGGAWTAWGSHGGVWQSDPVVVANGSRVFMFGRGTDGELYRTTYNGGPWSAWTAAGSPTTADPAAVDLGTGFMVFARTATGEVTASEYTGSSWTAWENLGGTTDPVRGAATA